MQALTVILLGFALRANAGVVPPPGSAAVASRPVPAVVLFVQASGADAAAIEDVFLGQPVAMRPDAQFIKVNIVFADAVKLQQVKVDTCGEELKDGVEFLFSPSGTRHYAEGGQTTATGPVGKRGEAVRSLTINFGHNEKVCIKSLRFLAESGRLVETRFPIPVAATVKGYSESEMLFDSKPETAVRAPADGTPAVITFDAPQLIEKVQIWNGDQANAAAFSGNSGLSKVGLKGDGGFQQTVSLARASGMHEIKLAKPYTGRKFEIKGLTPGKISEIRFVNARGVFFPRDLRLLEAANRRRATFASLELGRALDRQLRAGGEEEGWIFRFRSDGSFFVYGFDEDLKSSRRFSASGSFDIGSVVKNKLHLSLLGLRRTTPFAWDANPCGIACGDREEGRTLTVKELITLERIGSGEIVLRNVTSALRRVLPFGDLRSRPTTLQE